MLVAQAMTQKSTTLTLVNYVRRLGGTTRCRDGTLVTVDFRYGTAINDRTLVPLSVCHSLRTISVRHSAITDRGLRQLAKCRDLRTLDCGDTRVTGNGLRHLHGECSLRTLDLDGDLLEPSERNLTYIWAHRRLTHLNLAHTLVSDSQLEPLVSLRHLRILALDDARIHDVTLANIAMLRSLQMLFLSKTKVTDSGIKSLAGLKHLELLDLAHCRGVTDKSVEALCQLPKLRALTIYESGISNRAYRTIAKRLNWP